MSRRAALVLVLVAVLAWLVWLFLRESPAETTDVPAPREVVRPREKDAPLGRHHDADAAPPAAEAPPAPAPDPPAVQGPTITGRVTDADGRPVVGARVVSHPDDLTKPLETSKAGADGSRSFTVKSTDDGRFEVRVDPKTVEAILTVDADAGFGQASARPRDRDVAIKLVKWTVLAGKVTDVAKAPIAGAKVTAHLLIDAIVEDHATVSDADGNYQIERLPPTAWTPDLPFVGRGRHGWVIAEADGFAPLLAEFESRGLIPPKTVDTKAFDIVLVRGMTLTGKVVDGDTKAPIVGATVVAWSVEGMTSFGGAGGAYISNPWGPRPLGETTSGDDGTFRFDHLPAQGPSGVATHNSGKRGQTLGHVAAWKDGYVFGGDEIPVSKDEATVDETIELWPSATITGRVVDQDGRPVAGASTYVNVDARRPALNGFPGFYAESKSASSRTDADGRYALTSFRASRNAPTTGKLAAATSVGGQYLSSTPIDVTADAGATVAAPDIVLDVAAMPQATIVVRDAAGAPIVGALVDRPSGSPGFALRTGLDGRVSWALRAASKPGSPVLAASVVVRATGFASQKVELTPTLKTPVEVNVVMKPGARIAGRVLKSDGAPGARATVLVADGTKTPDEVFGDGSIQAQMSRAQKFVIYAYASADADGNFEVADLPDGPYLVAAQMPSGTPADFNRQPRQLRDLRPGVAAGTTDLVFTIPPDEASPTQALEIVVTDDAGGSVEKCWAWATIAGSRFFAQPRGATTLRFDALPPGTGAIDVSAPGWATTTVRDVRIAADAPSQPLAVRLERGIAVRGTVRVDVGRVPDDAVVVLQSVEGWSEGGSSVATIQKDGTFAATGLLPGRYRATVHGSEFRAGSVYAALGGEVVVVPAGGREITHDLTVALAGTISVSVRDARLPPSPMIGGAANAGKDRFGTGSRVEIVDGSGAIVAALSPVYAGASAVWLAPGDYVVRVRLSGESAQDQRCVVKAGESTPVRFPAQ